MDEKEQYEILNRLDERTKHIQSSVERVDSRLDDQEGKIEENRARSKKNQTKIALGTYTGGAFLSAIAAKIMGVFPH